QKSKFYGSAYPQNSIYGSPKIWNYALITKLCFEDILKARVSLDRQLPMLNIPTSWSGRSWLHHPKFTSQSKINIT
ncbi:17795_t:CDS:1, partial [Racocetra persica]